MRWAALDQEVSPARAGVLGGSVSSATSFTGRVTPDLESTAGSAMRATGGVTGEATAGVNGGVVATATSKLAC